MKITIWDLDYYYAKEKVNCFNPDAMKIASYHKQCGDQINFVLKKDDIYRPYDIYYIIKENETTPNAPFEFYTNGAVRWWGKAYKRKINWHMPDAMLACRPDYLLYPEKNTDWERGEQIRFLNNKGELLPIKQNWRNSFHTKRVIVTDTNLWTTSKENLKKVLIELQNVLNVAFFEPIWLPKLASDEELLTLFLKLHIQRGVNFQWVPIPLTQYSCCIRVIEKMKEHWKEIKINPLIIKIFAKEHWKTPDAALQDWNGIKEVIINAKKRRIAIELRMISSRMDTPYFLLFETISNWTHNKFQYSWLEWITTEYGPGLKFGRNIDFWGHPEKWNEVFRDLLRQTYTDKDFLTIQWGESSLSENDIPWKKWQEVFIYGI